MLGRDSLTCYLCGFCGRGDYHFYSSFLFWKAHNPNPTRLLHTGFHRHSVGIVRRFVLSLALWHTSFNFSPLLWKAIWLHSTSICHMVWKDDERNFATSCRTRKDRGDLRLCFYFCGSYDMYDPIHVPCISRRQIVNYAEPFVHMDETGTSLDSRDGQTVLTLQR